MKDRFNELVKSVNNKTFNKLGLNVIRDIYYTPNKKVRVDFFHQESKNFRNFYYCRQTISCIYNLKLIDKVKKTYSIKDGELAENQTHMNKIIVSNNLIIIIKKMLQNLVHLDSMREDNVVDIRNKISDLKKTFLKSDMAYLRNELNSLYEHDFSFNKGMLHYIKLIKSLISNFEKGKS